MKKTLWFAAILASVQTLPAWADTDPTAVKLKIYKWAVSKNVDCSDLTTVFETESPTETDFIQEPTLGEGSLKDGIYPCVVFEISDQVKVTPTADDGSYCTADTEFTYDICQSGTSKLISGSEVTCTDADDKVAVYLSTLSQETGTHEAYDEDNPDDNSAFLPAELEKPFRGFKISKSLTVNGSATSTFVVNFTGKVYSDAAACALNAPKWGFR